MDSYYENVGYLPSATASGGNRGNSTEEQERERGVCPPKQTNVLLIVFAVSLVFALGGLCILGILYANVSMQLSAQKTNNTIIVRNIEELTANYTRVREQLSFYEESLNGDMSCKAFNGKLYFFSSNKMDWSSSRAFCVSKGADLVTITSQTEQVFLASKIKAWYWIGLNDLETEGHWVWVNNQTLNETGVQFWHKRESEKSEPDNWKEEDPTGENCAILKNDLSYLENWCDVSCKYEMKFICEKK